MLRTHKLFAALAAGALLLAGVGCSASSATQDKSAASASTTVVRDHWNREVVVPQNPQRAVVMEWEGLVAKTMQMVGVGERIVGVDKSTKKQTMRRQIIPSIEKATDVGSPWSGVNYEALAGLKPDVVFMEAWVASPENRKLHEDVLKKIEAFKIPVIVMTSPSNFDKPQLDTAWQHIDYVGQVFGRKSETDKIISGLTRRVDDVRARVAKASGTAPEAAIFASTNYVMGEKSIQSYLLTDVLKAKNVAGPGTFIEMSEEKLLALSPKNLIVIGHEGYISTEQVLGGKNIGVDWSKVATMPAIADKKVTALGYDEWRATVETPVALMKMGKLLYPAQFADVDVAAEEKKFYTEVLGIDPSKVDDVIKAQQFVGELAEK